MHIHTYTHMQLHISMMITNYIEINLINNLLDGRMIASSREICPLMQQTYIVHCSPLVTHVRLLERSPNM